MNLHATTLEVILIAGVGAYIGFLIGLRWGVHLGANHCSDSKAAENPNEDASPSSSKKNRAPTAT